MILLHLHNPEWRRYVLRLRGAEDTEIYIDDIGIFSNSWDSHLKRLDTVLDKLQENNFIIHPRKCEWAVKETDWLSYWLTPDGMKPWTKKVDAILKMKAHQMQPS